MVYKMLFMFVLMFIQAAYAKSDEISLIKDIKSNSVDMEADIENDQVETADEVSSQINAVVSENRPNASSEDVTLRAFIDAQNEKFRQIKILDLDLRKADLELRRKEIQAKISALDGTVIDGPQAVNIKTEQDVKIGLKGVIGFEQDRQAIVSINNNPVAVSVGGGVTAAYSVVRILDDSVVLKDKNGSEKHIRVGELI